MSNIGKRPDLSYKHFEKWLNEVLSEKMSDNIKAFCFNIYDDGNEEWSVELIGSKSFDTSDNDWPCDEVFTTRSNPLKWSNLMTWQKQIKILKSCIEQYLQNGKYSQMLLSKQGIGYGFVDGDLHIL